MNKQAFLIMADSNAEQLKTLITLLDSKYIDIYVHIDKKSKINTKSFNGITKESKVFFVPRMEVFWGGLSMIRCEYGLFKCALKNGSYSYFHLISGKDIPLRSVDEIYNFFESHLNQEFVAFETAQNFQHARATERVSFYHFMPEMSFKSSKKWVSINFWKIYRRFESDLQRILKIDFFSKYKLDLKYGSQWVSVDTEFLEYLISKEELVYKIFKNAVLSDELFIQTILYNNSYFRKKLFYFNNTLEYSNLRYIDWNRGRPYIWRIDDKEKLTDASERGFMFARKFDAKVDKNIIHFLSKLKSR